MNQIIFTAERKDLTKRYGKLTLLFRLLLWACVSSWTALTVKRVIPVTWRYRCVLRYNIAPQKLEGDLEKNGLHKKYLYGFSAVYLGQLL